MRTGRDADYSTHLLPRSGSYNSFTPSRLHGGNGTDFTSVAASGGPGAGSVTLLWEAGRRYRGDAMLPSAGCVVPLLFVFEEALRPKVRCADITLDSKCLAFLSCCHVNSIPGHLCVIRCCGQVMEWLRPEVTVPLTVCH
jgi:hypothetical protein